MAGENFIMKQRQNLSTEARSHGEEPKDPQNGYPLLGSKRENLAGTAAGRRRQREVENSQKKSKTRSLLCDFFEALQIKA
jgi:hypothetical protein